MAVDADEILGQPAFLAWGCDDLSAAFPHGGTDLGASETGVRLHAKVGRLVLKAEESGERILDVLYTETELMLTVVLHQWNDTNLALAFPGGLTAAGATTSEKVIQFPGTEKAGARQSANADVLVASPIDLTNNKAILARRAIPMIQETAELNWRLRDPTKLALVFYCTNDEAINAANAKYNSRCLAIGDRTDITI